MGLFGLINEIKVKTLSDSIKTVEESLSVIRAVKHKISWGNSLHSRDLALILDMNEGDKKKLLSLENQILATISMISLILNRDKKSKSYKLDKDLVAYLNNAKLSLENDLRVLLEYVPERRAA